MSPTTGAAAQATNTSPWLEIDTARPAKRRGRRALGHVVREQQRCNGQADTAPPYHPLVAPRTSAARPRPVRPGSGHRPHRSHREEAILHRQRRLQTGRGSRSTPGLDRPGRAQIGPVKPPPPRCSMGAAAAALLPTTTSHHHRCHRQYRRCVSLPAPGSVHSLFCSSKPPDSTAKPVPL